MNAGIQDAFNLAWKLGLVASKFAHADLLDSYESERMPIDLSIIRWTDRGTRLLFSRGSTAHTFLRQLLSNLTRFDFVRQRITRAASQIATNYRGSSIVEEHTLAAGPRAGDRAPDATVQVAATGASIRLFDLFGEGRHALLLLWPKDFDAAHLNIGD